MTCPSSADRCGTAHVKGKVADVSIAVYAKGCTTSSVCNSDSCKAFVTDSSANITKCELDCCSGNLCNKAKIPTPKPTPEYGLKCYQCFSQKSWDECASNKKVMTCSSGADRCGTAHVEGEVGGVTVSVYGKGCSTSSVCNSDSCKRFVSDPSTKITKCEIDCCRGDLCNIAKLPTPMHGLKCYQCFSTTGWDDCAAKRRVITCPSGLDRCGKAQVVGTKGNVSESVYTKGCSSSAICNQRGCTALGGSANIIKCKNNCCSGDLCNGAKVPMVIVIILVACAIVVFFFS